MTQMNTGKDLKSKFVRATCGLSAILFAVVFILHSLRYFLGWQFEYGPFAVPSWVSVGMIVICAVLLTMNLVVLLLFKNTVEKTHASKTAIPEDQN